MPSHAAFNPTDRARRGFGKGAMALAVGLPLVVVLLIFVGMIGQFDQAAWNLYNEVYRPLPDAMGDRARADVYLQFTPDNPLAASARERIAQFAEESLLPGHQLSGLEIHFRRGDDRFEMTDLKTGALAKLGRDGFPGDYASREATELTGSLRTAKLDAPMPRLFWIGEMQLLLPVAAPANAQPPGAGGQNLQALLLLRINPHDMRVFMGQLAGLGLLIYLLLGVTMALVIRGVLERSSAKALAEQRRRDLNLLHAVTLMLERAASDNFDFKEILGEIVAGLGVDAAGIYRCDGAGVTKAALPALIGLSCKSGNALEGEPLAGAALQFLSAQTAPLFVDDVAALKHLRDAPLFTQGCRSLAWLPMFSRDGLLGALFVAALRPKAPDEEERHILEVIAMNLTLIFMGETVREEFQLRGRRVEELSDQAAFAQDQQRILQAHLDRSREYETIFEQAQDFVFLLDELGRFTKVNPVFPLFLGYAEREMIGQEMVKFCHTGDLAWFRRDLETVLAGGSAGLVTVRLRCHDQRWRFVEANLSPIPGRALEARGIFGIARDATEARLTDMRQKRLLGAREVIADLRIGLPLHDLLSSAVALIGKLFGVDWVAILLGESDAYEGQGWQTPDEVYEPGAVLGKPMRGYLYRRASKERYFMSGDIMADFFAQAAPAEAAACRRRPLTLSCEGASIVSADGERHGVMLLFHESAEFFHGWDEMPLRNLGSELGNLISQKFMESQILIQNQELAERTRRATEATQLKSRFLAAISHELRTPLHAIIGFTEVVMDKTPELPPRRMRNLDAVLRNARMLLTLIEDLLDLSRIEAGKVKVRTEAFNVGDLLEEVAQAMRSLVEIKGLDLRVETLEAERQAMTDRGKVRQVLVNLVANAIKFTQEGGIWMRAEFDDVRMRISVQDTGIGIAADDLGAIFQEFEQINAAETENKRGTGLGLALSQRLAGVLGGSIYVQTMAGEGSTFTLDIPLYFEFAERADRGAASPLFEVDANDTLPNITPTEKP